jgi:integrase
VKAPLFPYGPNNGTACPCESGPPRLRRLPAIRFHDPRHAPATLLLSLGEHPKVVQERLGHSTISVTMDVYSHVMPDLQRQAAAKLDQLLARRASS